MKGFTAIACLAVTFLAASCSNPDGNESFRESMRDKKHTQDQSHGNGTDVSDTLDSQNNPVN